MINREIHYQIKVIIIPKVFPHIRTYFQYPIIAT